MNYFCLLMYMEYPAGSKPWRIEPAARLYDALQPFVSNRRSIDGGVPVPRWPVNLLLPSSSPRPLDVSSWPIEVPVVSEKTRQICEQIAPGQLQFLPVHLTYRGRALRHAGPYWAANRLISVDCGRALEGEENWRIDPRRVPPGAHVFCIKGWGPMFIVSQELKAEWTKAGVRGVRFRALREIRLPQRNPGRLRLPRAKVFSHAATPEPVKVSPRPPRTMAALVPWLVESGLATISGAGSQAALRGAERRLGVRLPSQLQEWALKTGGGVVGGEEVYGLRTGRRAVCEFDLVQATMQQRRIVSKWPASCIVIGGDGAGNCYYIDAAAVKPHQPPVMEWNHERAGGMRYNAQSVRKVAGSLWHWLVQLSQNSVAPLA